MGGEKGGKGGTEVGGKGDYIPTATLSVTTDQNDSCIKMGSDENHFNVSLIVRDKLTRQCPQTTIFEEKGQSRSGFDPWSLCLAASERLTARPNRLTCRWRESVSLLQQ